MNDLNKPIAALTISPWLSIQNATAAIVFYKQAFDAEEIYRLDTPDGGVVVKLSVSGAEFWVSSENDEPGKTPPALGGGNVRMILTVAEPDALFAQALAAGAAEIFPIGEDYGWRLGRLVDPFGLHWEIGHPLNK